MKESFDESLLNAMEEITGLTGSQLYVLTGTVYATSFLGKMPNQKDTAIYLGVATRTVNKTLRNAISQAFGGVLPDEVGPLAEWFGDYLTLSGPRPTIVEVVYPLATELISRGLFFDHDEESTDRLIARVFLSTMFAKQSVQSFEEFVGYNTVLEYLWQVVTGSEDTVDEFIKVRFEPDFAIVAKIQAFCYLIYEQNPHLKELKVSPDYYDICEYLAKAVIGAKIKALKNGSAANAKERLIKILA